MFVQVTAKMFEMFFETQCSILSNALLTASLFWDCDRFWSFGLLHCMLPYQKICIPIVRRSPPPILSARGNSVPLSPLRYATGSENAELRHCRWREVITSATH